MSELELSGLLNKKYISTEIIATKNISWFFPSKRLKNIDKWLNFFEPNHQTMLISKNLANKMDFPIEYGIIADGYWKRKILKHAKKVIYLKTPLIKFFLDGVSSSRPSNKVIQEIINKCKKNELINDIPSTLITNNEISTHKQQKFEKEQE